jgi:hypothetical protein
MKGVVRNFIVVKGLTRRLPKNFVPDTLPFKRVTNVKESVKQVKAYKTENRNS